MPRVLPHASRSVLDDVEMITGGAVALAVPPAPLAVRIAGAAIEVTIRVALQIRLYSCLSQVMEGASQAPSPRHQRLGHGLAGTLVRARNSWTTTDPAAMPPQRARWGATEEDILAEHYRRERQRLQADAALTARLFPNRRSADTHL